MSRIQEFFVEEAEECMRALRDELSNDEPDPIVLYRSARQLRGSAQVARYGGLAGDATELEELLKGVARGDASWDEETEGRVRTALRSLEEEVEGVREGRVQPDPEEREPREDPASGEQTAVEVVPIETLEYQGAAALERALTLREAVEEAAGEEAPSAVVAELFDLIRLGTR
ncbi:MAG: Hpt domain-containing protein [Longimicrobiales bacterium]|nr:Hpt domain-containing protein [Longimicrobiales bacterium]